MNAILAREARGASAYVQVDRPATRPADEWGRDPAQDWGPTVDELLRFRLLTDDWDGEGTEAPHPSLVDKAIALTRDLRAVGVMPPDRVIVGVNATVFFEWYSPRGYWEIEVMSPVAAESRWLPTGATTTEVVPL